jgi:hypothetical protein
MKTGGLLLLLAPALAVEYPSELFHADKIDAVLEQDGGEGSLFGGLHFNMPEAFGDVHESFLELRANIQAGTAAHAAVDPVDVGRVDFRDEPPILCETICRPVNDTEMQSARAEAGAGEASVANAAAQGEANAAALAPGGEMSTMFMELESKICTAKGGGWVNGVEDGATGRCEEYMRASEATTKYHPQAIFKVCSAEFGENYVPCSPYQALGLANLYDIPDKSHYRLWPGGRPDQVTNAAMKQQIGNNPSSGLDTCPDEQHVGFFHNWDGQHVDSWGCLHDELYMKVLCCRRGIDKKAKVEAKPAVEKK